MERKTVIAIENPALSYDGLLRAAHMDDQSDPEDLEKLRKIFGEAQAIAVPKLLYGLVQVESRDEKGVVLDGVRFRSGLMSKNLANTSRAVAFVVTCGMEAEKWSEQYHDDPLTQFWTDCIKLQLLGIARARLNEEVRQFFPSGDISAMTPGSLAAWPITQERPLFQLLGGVTEDIGACLTDSCLILPFKSGSGILFSSKEHHVNCRYCPLLKCPNRRAPFEHELEGVSEDE